MQVVFVFSLLAQVFLASAAQANSLLEVQAFIKQGQAQRAAKILEDLFEHPDSEAQQQRASFLLSSLEGVELKASRSYYAGFCARRCAFLTAKEKQPLLRIAADGYFSDANLKKAEEFYLMALAADHLTNSEQAYLQYKLAWVYVNLKLADKALIKFHESLKIEPNGPLSESASYDLGKIWTENLNTTRLPTNLSLSKTQADQLAKGALQGMQRARRKLSELDNVPISNSKLRGFLRKNIIESKASWGLSSCAVLTYFEVATDWADRDLHISEISKCLSQNRPKPTPPQLKLAKNQLERLEPKAHEKLLWLQTIQLGNLALSPKHCGLIWSAFKEITKLTESLHTPQQAVAHGLQNCSFARENTVTPWEKLSEQMATLTAEQAHTVVIYLAAFLKNESVSEPAKRTALLYAPPLNSSSPLIRAHLYLDNLKAGLAPSTPIDISKKIGAVIKVVRREKSDRLKLNYLEQSLKILILKQQWTTVFNHWSTFEPVLRTQPSLYEHTVASAFTFSDKELFPTTSPFKEISSITNCMQKRVCHRLRYIKGKSGMPRSVRSDLNLVIRLANWRISVEQVTARSAVDKTLEYAALTQKKGPQVLEPAKAIWSQQLIEGREQLLTKLNQKIEQEQNPTSKQEMQLIVAKLSEVTL